MEVHWDSTSVTYKSREGLGIDEERNVTQYSQCVWYTCEII